MYAPDILLPLVGEFSFAFIADCHFLASSVNWVYAFEKGRMISATQSVEKVAFTVICYTGGGTPPLHFWLFYVNAFVGDGVLDVPILVFFDTLRADNIRHFSNVFFGCFIIFKLFIKKQKRKQHNTNKTQNNDAEQYDKSCSLRAVLCNVRDRIQEHSHVDSDL